MAKVNALREWWSSRASEVLARIETQSATREELRPLFGPTLLPSILDKAFKGEFVITKGVDHDKFLSMVP